MNDVIRKNRLFIMGMAILWVAIYHMPQHTNVLGLSFLQDIGYGGVDIFVFVSGYGIFKSLEKDANLYRYLGRRLKRLLPSYIPFIVIWMLIRYITYQLYVTEIMGNLTMTGWWNGSSNQFNWYIDGIVLFYILAPYIYGVIKNNRKWYCIGGLLSISFAVSMAFWHGILLTAMSRLPIFVLGMILSSRDTGAWLNVDRRIELLLTNVIMVLGLGILYYCLHQDRFDRWHYGLWWYPFFAIVPGLVYDLGLVGNILSKFGITKLFFDLINSLGESSFEIFLMHLFVFETASASGISDEMIWGILFATSLLLGCLYHKMITIIMQIGRCVNFD